MSSNTKVLIYWPRLDCTFKEGHCPSVHAKVSELPPIRQWWHLFLTQLAQDHQSIGHEVVIIKKPLWQMKPEDADEYKPHITYVPHRLPEHFPLPEAYGARYYMQTVLPWLFSVSPNGWGARLAPEIERRINVKSISNIMASSDQDFSDVVETDLKFDLHAPDFGVDSVKLIRTAQALGHTKFPQVARRLFPDKDYLLFVCQLPHDDTIRYFSKISVIDALAKTSDIAREVGVPLIVKGHVANPDSQKPLLEFARSRGHQCFLNEYHILDLIEPARAVFSVNSGTTIEAMAMGKMVWRFGDAEYNYVVPSALDDDLRPNIVHFLKNQDYKIDLSVVYESWLNTWYHFCFDASNAKGPDALRSFNSLLSSTC